MSEPRPQAFGLAPGARLGRYEVLAQLGIGGMAELYVARQSGLSGFERIVALKRILPHLTADDEFVRMFLDEARIAASLDHPNIAQVTDIDIEGGQYFFAMEFVHGRDLRQVVKAGGALTMSVALRIVSHVAAGLHHAHEARDPLGRPLGLVHRDVSPSNVMIAYSGAVKLTDFGIAKASEQTSRTLEGRIKGKVGYMSPEQCRGESVDRRSDIFALGILLYELTTSMRAFYSQNDFATMARITRAEYVKPSEHDPSYPPALEQIIARALAKDPADRYATAAEVRDAIEDHARTEQLALGEAELAAHMRATFGTPDHPQTLTPLPAVEVGQTERVSPPRRWWIPAFALTLLAAGVGVALRMNHEPEVEVTPSQEPAVPVLAPVPSEPDLPPVAPAPDVGAPEPEASESEPEPEPEPAPKPKRSRRKAKSSKPRKASGLPYPPGYE